MVKGMSEKRRIEISNAIEKDLMRSPRWKGYMQGLKDGEKKGGVGELKALLAEVLELESYSLHKARFISKAEVRILIEGRLKTLEGKGLEK